MELLLLTRQLQTLQGAGPQETVEEQPPEPMTYLPLRCTTGWQTLLYKEVLRF